MSLDRERKDLANVHEAAKVLSSQISQQNKVTMSHLTSVKTYLETLITTLNQAMRDFKNLQTSKSAADLKKVQDEFKVLGDTFSKLMEKWAASAVTLKSTSLGSFEEMKKKFVDSTKEPTIANHAALREQSVSLIKQLDELQGVSGKGVEEARNIYKAYIPKVQQATNALTQLCGAGKGIQGLEKDVKELAESLQATVAKLKGAQVAPAAAASSSVAASPQSHFNQQADKSKQAQASSSKPVGGAPRPDMK